MDKDCRAGGPETKPPALPRAAGRCPPLRWSFLGRVGALWRERKATPTGGLNRLGSVFLCVSFVEGAGQVDVFGWFYTESRRKALKKDTPICSGSSVDPNPFHSDRVRGPQEWPWHWHVSFFFLQKGHWAKGLDWGCEQLGCKLVTSLNLQPTNHDQTRSIFISYRSGDQIFVQFFAGMIRKLPQWPFGHHFR